MKELLSMLERLVPDIRDTNTWKKGSWRWVRNYQDLQRLRVRRPELYEGAMTALVKYIADNASEELAARSEAEDEAASQKRRRRENQRPLM